MFPIKWQCWGIPVFAILAQTNMRSLVFVGYMLVIYIYNQERIPWILILAWNPLYVLHKSKAYDISQYIMIYIYIWSLPHQNLPLALNSVYIYAYPTMFGFVSCTIQRFFLAQLRRSSPSNRATAGAARCCNSNWVPCGGCNWISGY
jgi:hypothetical protein